MRSLTTASIAVLLLMVNGCASEPQSNQDRQALNSSVRSTLATMRAEDPSFGPFLDDAYGYAVFPSVGKGGLIVGGAYGRGEVYERGRLIGYSSITQGTIGAQVGGQDFAEVICFRNKEALDQFTSGKFEPTAAASAVALKAGAARSAAYSNDVAIFAFVKGGLMAEAAVGGQKFAFTPAEEMENR